MVKKHTTIKMAQRVEQLSIAKFSSKNLSREEKSQEFLEVIIDEWVIKPDPEDKSKHYRQVVWDENEEHFDGDEPKPIPCICGQPITKGEYYICVNILNGNMIRLGAKCYETFHSKERGYKDYTKRINRKLRYPDDNSKRYFENMSDYTRAVVEETIKEWVLLDCVKYLHIYQDNDVIRMNLIEEVTKKTMRQTTAQTVKLEALKRQVKLERKFKDKAMGKAAELEVDLILSKEHNERLTIEVKRYRDIRNANDTFMNTFNRY